MFDHILDLHFDPKSGAAYWLEVLKKRRMTRDDFRTSSDLIQLGPMDLEALRTRPITDFIPRSQHQHLSKMILSETGGNTGDPCHRVYFPDEFHRAFVAPWLEAAALFGFPIQRHWLFIGPSGPHIIAQAARAFARATNCLEPFSIDCDVRWIKQQQHGSMGYLLYMEHLFNQATNIINQQDITVLFTTPPLLVGLAERMTKTQRLQIEGIHTGGMAQDVETSRKLEVFFPNAVILPGYGNSLFGVAFEKQQVSGQPSVFFVHDQALRLRLIPLPENKEDAPRLSENIAENQRGRIVFSRFDTSFLILNMLERDTAIRVVCNNEEGFGDIEGLAINEKIDGEVY